MTIIVATTSYIYSPYRYIYIYTWFPTGKLWRDQEDRLPFDHGWCEAWQRHRWQCGVPHGRFQAHGRVSTLQSQPVPNVAAIIPTMLGIPSNQGSPNHWLGNHSPSNQWTQPSQPALHWREGPQVGSSRCSWHGARSDPHPPTGPPQLTAMVDTTNEECGVSVQTILNHIQTILCRLGYHWLTWTHCPVTLHILYIEQERCSEVSHD